MGSQFRRRLLYILLHVALSVYPALAADSTQFDHSPLDSVLARFVDDGGRVGYAALKQNPADLDRYVGMLAATSPENRPDLFPGRADSLAYWINAYNAFVLKGVIDAYPVTSVKQIKLFFGFFKRVQFVAGGRDLTLDDIEHGILRTHFKEPRIHAAINCASVGCPKLAREAYRPERLERQLKRAMQQFMRDPLHVRLVRERHVVHLSEILDWFGDDFTKWYADRFGEKTPGVLDYVALFREDADRAFLKTDPRPEVEHIDYDWALNDQAAVRQGTPGE